MLGLHKDLQDWSVSVQYYIYIQEFCLYLSQCGGSCFPRLLKLFAYCLHDTCNGSG